MSQILVFATGVVRVDQIAMVTRRIEGREIGCNVHLLNGTTISTNDNYMDVVRMLCRLDPVSWSDHAMQLKPPPFPGTSPT